MHRHIYRWHSYILNLQIRWQSSSSIILTFLLIINMYYCYLKWNIEIAISKIIRVEKSRQHRKHWTLVKCNGTIKEKWGKRKRKGCSLYRKYGNERVRERIHLIEADVTNMTEKKKRERKSLGKTTLVNSKNVWYSVSLSRFSLHFSLFLSFRSNSKLYCQLALIHKCVFRCPYSMHSSRSSSNSIIIIIILLQLLILPVRSRSYCASIR